MVGSNLQQAKKLSVCHRSGVKVSLSLSAPPLAGQALPRVGTNRPRRWGAGLCVLRWGVGVDGRATRERQLAL